MHSISLVTLVVLMLKENLQSYAYTTRTYDLEVPGSKPIRIIEADPGWDAKKLDRNDRIDPRPYHGTRRGDRDDRYVNRPEFEHRTLRPDIITNRNDRNEDDYEDNSEKLKKFLSNYAQSQLALNKQPHVEVNGNGNAVKDELVLKDKFVDEFEEDGVEKPEKSKSWNLLHFDKVQQNAAGPPDQKGWVSMEAVPWSVSKISKWHGKPKKDKYQNNYYDQVNNNNNNRPFNDRFHNQPQASDYPRPNYPKPIRPASSNHQRPSSSSSSSGYYDEVEEDDFEEPIVDDDYYNKRPSFSRPTATYGHKVNVHTVQTYGPNKRPHKHDSNCNHNHHHHQNEQGGQGEIITDGLPANFPEHDYGNRRRGVGSDATMPATHPFKGDVLPPLDDGRVNMTTSHGGLLQVDATFQSVDEAQKAYVRKQKLKIRHPQRRPLKIRPQLAPLESISQLQQQQQIQYHLQANKDNIADGSSSDAGAVLAAVGAGMIPAGMALLVPMAMSAGKRRRRQVDFYPNLITDHVEFTLPTSL